MIISCTGVTEFRGKICSRWLVGNRSLISYASVPHPIQDQVSLGTGTSNEIAFTTND